MPNPKGSKLDLDALMPEEYAAIRPELQPLRMRVLYDLLWTTGIRIGEALRLRRNMFVYAIDNSDGPVALQINRLKKRSAQVIDRVPVPGGLGLELHEISDQDLPGGLVFPSDRNRLKPLTSQGCWKALKAAATRAGVRVENGSGHSTVRPHLYRHGFGRQVAKRLASTLGELEARTTIQGMLSHANFATSAIYLRQNPTEFEATWREIQDELWTPAG